MKEVCPSYFNVSVAVQSAENSLRLMEEVISRYSSISNHDHVITRAYLDNAMRMCKSVCQYAIDTYMLVVGKIQRDFYKRVLAFQDKYILVYERYEKAIQIPVLIDATLDDLPF